MTGSPPRVIARRAAIGRATLTGAAIGRATLTHAAVGLASHARCATSSLTARASARGLAGLTRDRLHTTRGDLASRALTFTADTARAIAGNAAALARATGELTAGAGASTSALPT